MNYTIGFCFNKNRSSVVLIKKQKPQWQAGRLNGVGGKIEENESPISAMVREFLEETGVKTSEKNWRHFATMKGIDWQKDHSGNTNAIVYCFDLEDNEYFSKARTMEKEEIIKINLLYIPISNSNIWIPNLSVLIPLACSSEFINPIELIWSQETIERKK